MAKSKARGIRPGIFKSHGRKNDYIYAETTTRPGEEDGYYKPGWVDYVGTYTTVEPGEDPGSTQSASDGMLTYEWRRAKHRHVAWKKVPKGWQKWFRKHLDKSQYEKAKKN